jgi:hypothetical protein
MHAMCGASIMRGQAQASDGMQVGASRWWQVGSKRGRGKWGQKIRLGRKMGECTPAGERKDWYLQHEE